ncbi:MAG TPA: membrane protein insertase YidC, partial [Deltaproteobacteria bacterium]|nr:membrane protein insertase YidC [Deltaproteobacteria bacterium]
MDMEKRTLLAFAISMVIISVWFLVMEPRRAEMQKQAPAEKPKTAATTVTRAQPETPAAVPAASVKEEFIVTETPLYRAAWSTRGGRLVSLKLKRYKESLSEKSGPVEMITSPMPNLAITGGMSDENLVYTASAQGTVAVDRSPYQLTFTAQMAQGIIV